MPSLATGTRRSATLCFPVSFDAHIGTDLDAWARRNAHTDAQRKAAMNQALRAESDWWTSKTAAYGFGRVEVIRDGAEIARFEVAIQQGVHALVGCLIELRRQRWYPASTMNSGVASTLP